MKKLVLLILFGCFALPLFSQIDTLTEKQESWVDELENRLDNLDEGGELDTEELLEIMAEEKQRTKANLNDLSYETAILRLKFTDYQYYQLQLYIVNYGPLASIYELTAIDGFSEADLEHLSAWVTVVPPQTKDPFFKDFFKKSQSTLITKYGQVLEKQAGYDTTRNNHYPGSPGHASFRYVFNAKNRFQLKLSGEKDAGEQFFRGTQKQGFDLYTGSLSIKDVGLLQSAVIGDYKLNFGQGVVAGSSLLSGKGGDLSALRKFSTGIRAVAPANEGNFLRGGALTLGNARLNGTLFGGRQYGTLDNHLGADISYRHRLFKIGLRALAFSTTDTTGDARQRWNSTFLPHSFNVSLDYQVILKRQLLFGEAAVTEQGKIGILQAALLNLTPTARLAIIFRHYDQGFNTPLGKGFSAVSQGCGETGCYLTANIILSRNLEFNIYADYYLTHGLSWRTDAPYPGMDAGATLLYTLSRNSKLTLKYIWKTRSYNENQNEHLKALCEQNRHKVRLQWVNTPFAFLKLKTEADWILNVSSTEKKAHQGILIFQDAAFSFKNNLALHFRVAYFDTDRYDERLYAYEDDVYYAFTIGSYYYQGIRGYCVLRYKYKWLSLWLRIAQTYYINRNTISSGLTEIDKPHKTEVTLQIAVKL